MSAKRTRNVIKYVIPTMLSNVCFFLFTVVDGIFVGNGAGTNGLGAVNIVMPFVLIVGALFMPASIGGVTVFAIRLGRGDQKGANQAFIHAVIAVTMISALLTAAGVFFTDAICSLLGANETFLRQAADYLFWYSLFIIPSGLSMCLQHFCRNDGAPGLVSIAVIVSTACNIFGDWLLIFPFGMGTAGAAIATGFSQVIALLILLIHFIRRDGILRFSRAKSDGRLFHRIHVYGLAEAIGQIATPVTILCMNIVLLQTIGDIGVNAFSVITYLSSFTMAIFFGTSEGLQPLFGQSYGARNEQDLKFYFHVGLGINLIGSIVVAGLILLFAAPLCQLFGADAQTLAYAVESLPFYAWGFVVMSVNVMIASYLYSITRSGEAITINLLRSLIANTAVILLLPRLFGADIVWFTFGIYEAIVAVIAVALLRHSERNGIVF